MNENPDLRRDIRREVRKYVKNRYSLYTAASLIAPLYVEIVTFGDKIEPLITNFDPLYYLSGFLCSLGGVALRRWKNQNTTNLGDDMMMVIAGTAMPPIGHAMLPAGYYAGMNDHEDTRERILRQHVEEELDEPGLHEDDLITEIAESIRSNYSEEYV